MVLKHLHGNTYVLRSNDQWLGTITLDEKFNSQNGEKELRLNVRIDNDFQFYGMVGNCHKFKK